MITELFIEKEFKEEKDSNSSLLEVSKNPCLYFDKTFQNILSVVDEILEVKGKDKEKERITECGSVKEEPNSLNNDDIGSLKNSSNTNNSDFKTEKVPVKVETFEIKKRKMQKNSSKLKF